MELTINLVFAVLYGMIIANVVILSCYLLKWSYFPEGTPIRKSWGCSSWLNIRQAHFGVDTVLLGGSGASEGRFWGNMKPVPESEMSPGHFSPG